jgi:predicted molibdopterin-dependent oxidoreductase YjgC
VNSKGRQLPDDGGQFVRLDERRRSSVTLHLDGKPIEALAGDTLLVALLLHRSALRWSEFGDGPRAGFCHMGACQDCWVALEDGTRLRACTTYVSDGLRVASGDSRWPL